MLRRTPVLLLGRGWRRGAIKNHGGVCQLDQGRVNCGARERKSGSCFFGQGVGGAKQSGPKRARQADTKNTFGTGKRGKTKQKSCRLLRPALGKRNRREVRRGEEGRSVRRGNAAQEAWVRRPSKRNKIDGKLQWGKKKGKGGNCERWEHRNTVVVGHWQGGRGERQMILGPWAATRSPKTEWGKKGKHVFSTVLGGG